MFFIFLSDGAAPVGCECLLLDADREEAEAPAGGETGRQDEKGMEEELPKRTALVHRLRDYVSRVKSFLKRADNVYSDGLCFRSVSPRPLFMCSNFRKFQGQEVQKGQRINERLMFDFQSVDFVDSVALSNFGAAEQQQNQMCP